MQQDYHIMRKQMSSISICCFNFEDEFNTRSYYRKESAAVPPMPWLYQFINIILHTVWMNLFCLKYLKLQYAINELLYTIKCTLNYIWALSLIVGAYDNFKIPDFKKKMSFKVIHTFFLAILFPGNLNNNGSQQYDFLSNM